MARTPRPEPAPAVASPPRAPGAPGDSADAPAAGTAAPSPARRGGFVSHARLIGVITLISRVLGLGREMVAAAYFGAGPIWSAFTFAFTIPNLFRKLFGEGALSAAFIPMYARMVSGTASPGAEPSPRGAAQEKPWEIADAESDAAHSGPAHSGAARSGAAHADPATASPRSRTRSGEAVPQRFATASVNLLVCVLTAITLVGELVLGAVWLFVDLGRPDYELALVLTAIMLPYVVLICGAAFLGGILNVHDRFAAAAAASVMLNLCLIAAIVGGALVFDLNADAGRVAATKWLAVAVVLSGALQVAMLWPSLRKAGFRFDPRVPPLSPATRRMLRMSVPVALSAGVLQVSVLLDKSIAFFLAGAEGSAGLTVLGQTFSYPMAEGAAARLNWAQFMYQFPLGVFAIALATAIFPKLSRDAAQNDGRNDAFRDGLRRGVEAALYIGLPASAGLVLVAEPAVRVLFERGRFTPLDTEWTALSTAIYSAAVWAFSLQQILNRAYYALHDTTTPLVWAIVNLGMNLVIELPLIWTPLGEAGMAVGTLAAFSIQATVMLWMVSRRVGGIGLRHSVRPVAVMLLATALMTAACLLLRLLPFWPAGATTRGAAVQLLALMAVGGAVYFGATRLLSLRPGRGQHLPDSASARSSSSA